MRSLRFLPEVVWISGLMVTLGSDFGECPADMVQVSDTVCIDRFEWPNRKGQRPLIAASAVAETEDLEAGLIMDGERLCKQRNKRLCYVDEWVSACLGPEDAKFPFGNTLPRYAPGDNSGLCNYDKRFRNVDEYKVFKRDRDELSRLNQSEPSGSRQSCVSSSGAYDMMGNVEEWVRTRSGSYALAGRFWAEPWSCYSLSYLHAPNWHYYQSGFRCCLDI